MSLERNKNRIQAGSADFKEAASYAQEFTDLINDQKEKARVLDYWHNNFWEDPAGFFSAENLNNLKDAPAAERLLLLSKNSSCLPTTPEMVKEYFKVFPQDLEVVKNNFLACNGLPSDFFNHHLFCVVTPLIESDQQDNRFASYADIANRRSLTPKYFLAGYEKQGFGRLDKFSQELQNDFKRVYDKACDSALGGDYQIEAKELFTENFYSLPEEEKLDFLNNVLATLQHDLLFEEAFNSCFTEESVEQLKEINKSGSYLPAHSMLYKTPQSLSAYQTGQSFFDSQMNSTAQRGGSAEEYPFHRMILAVLREFKNFKNNQDEAVNVLVDFWDKNRNPIFANDLADDLSELDPNLAAGELMKCLNREKQDKNALTAMLYRLEFGRLGISKEGVKYLEKIYDLQEYNNPDFHVSRLTADGEIGIFDEDLKLIKFFHLGDLSSPEKKIRAQVLELAYETLFTPRADENEKEKEQRLAYLEEFKQNYYQLANDEVFKNTGARLNNLNFKEQGWFLVYFNQASEAEKSRLREFVTEFGEAGIRTFLALENGFAFGQQILDLSEKMETPAAKELFATYGSTLDKINEIGLSISSYFNQRAEPELQNFPQELQEALQRRTSDVFLAANQLLTKENNQLVASDARDSLEAINLFLEIVSDLAKNQKYEKIVEQENIIKSEIGQPEYNHQYLITNRRDGQQYRLRAYVRTLGHQQGEARISFALSFLGDRIVNPNLKMAKFFEQETEYKQSGEKKKSNDFTIRIDRDTKFDPPLVSLDLGRNKHEGVSLKRTGDRLGNLLTATTELGSHNTKSFNPRYAEAEVFSKLAEILEEFLAESSGS